LLVHAGDIGGAAILTRLSTIARVTAVRGNNDHGAWADALRDIEQIDVGGVRIFVIHDVNAMAVDPAAAGIDVVVSGHSHRPASGRRAGVLYVNPGSAGPRRFTLPIAAAELRIDGETVTAHLVTLVA